MNITTLSSKGQVVIPKVIRSDLNWDSGTRLSVIETGNGVLLTPVQDFAPVELSAVAGCLAYDGPPVSEQDMKEAIRKGVEERYGRG